MSGQLPLQGVFIPPRNGLAHRHVGSRHAVDEGMALPGARDVDTRRSKGNSIRVVPSASIMASDPDQAGENFEPGDKIYRHPSYHEVPEDLGHM